MGGSRIFGCKPGSALALRSRLTVNSPLMETITTFRWWLPATVDLQKVTIMYTRPNHELTGSHKKVAVGSVPNEHSDQEHLRIIIGGDGKPQTSLP